MQWKEIIGGSHPELHSQLKSLASFLANCRSGHPVVLCWLVKCTMIWVWSQQACAIIYFQGYIRSQPAFRSAAVLQLVSKPWRPLLFFFFFSFLREILILAFWLAAAAPRMAVWNHLWQLMGFLCGFFFCCYLIVLRRSGVNVLTDGFNLIVITHHFHCTAVGLGIEGAAKATHKVKYRQADFDIYYA